MSGRTKILACALALAFAACVPATSEEEEFGENSPMAAIQAEGTMVIAVPPDSPPFSSGGADGDPQGFVVDLGRHLAEALDVEAAFVEAPSDEMARLVAGDDDREIGDEQAHAAFPLTTITNQIYKVESRTMGYDATTPFFVAHQRLLVPQASTIETVEDLSGRSVCSLVDPELGVPIEDLEPGAEVEEASVPRDCAAVLRKGDADAVAGDEVDLLAVLADLEDAEPGGSYEIVGEQTTTQGYSPYVVRGMAGFASDVFTDVKADGRWSAAYDKWIAPLSGVEDVDPPALTLEEAAAMYPDITFPDE